MEEGAGGQSEPSSLSLDGLGEAADRCCLRLSCEHSTTMAVAWGSRRAAFQEKCLLPIFRP